MSNVTTALIKELRQKSGAGMMDCKEALVASEGSIEKAIEFLRKKGLKSIGKRAGKTVAEGCIGTYVHAGDQVAAIVELNCETDFVARGDEFKATAKALAMHVAALTPSYLKEEDVPEEVIEKEKSITLEQLNEAQKKNADKILPGKIKKYFQENVLLNQGFVKDDSKSVREILEELSMKVGEKVAIRRYSRYEVGEGVEVQKANLTDDVQALVSGS